MLLQSKKWAWVVGLFLIINIVGLVKIISLLERSQGRPSSISAFVSSITRNLPWVLEKTAQNITDKIAESTELVVKDVTPSAQGQAGSITVELSQDVDLSEIQGFIDIKPKIDFFIEQSYRGLTLNGNFLPRQAYTVEILKGMPSAEGLKLKETLTKTVVIPDYDPSCRLKVPGIYMALKGNQIIPAEAMNVDKLKLKIHRVYDNNIVYLLNNMTSYSFPEDLGIDAVEKEIKTGSELNKSKDVYFDLKDILGENSRGLFYVSLSSPDIGSSEDSKLILTTDIGLVVKKSNSELFVWANALSTATPISGAIVKVFSKTNQQLLEGTTDENGIAHFKDVQWADDRKPFVVTASSGTDLVYVELEKTQIAETGFDVEGRPYLSGGYEAFVYSERGIYRPGETAHIRAIVRGVGVETPESFPVILEVVRPDSKVMRKFNGMLSDKGIVDFDLALPDYALTGRYNTNILLPGGKDAIGDAVFNVEEFMPERMKVSVDIAEKRYGIADTMPVTVKADQLIGVPAEGRTVELSYALRPKEFKPAEFDGFVFNDETKPFVDKETFAEEKLTDNEGKALFEIKLPVGLRPGSSLESEIKAVVKEVGGRSVTAYAGRTVDPYPFYIGIRKTTDGYASVNEKAEFQYVIVSPDGKKIDVPELEVSVSKIVWNSIIKKDDKGEYRYISENIENEVLKETIKAGEVSGVFPFTPTAAGDYVIRIKGKAEGTHTSSLKFYSAENGIMPWAMERPDRIELTLDKKNYAIGETARLVVKSSIVGRALITIAKDKIVSTQVMDLTSSTQEIPIFIEDAFNPNVYCAVSVISAVTPGEDWSHHRAYGVIPIVIDNKQKKMELKITAPEKAAPRDKIKIEVDAGAMANADISLALVDEGVLQLTKYKLPDPFEFFYGKRGYYLATSDIYSFLVPEFDKKKVGADSTPSADGGSYDPKKRLNPINAKRVKPVALWKAGIVLDAQGKASVEFDIPEFTGSLKVMAVGVADGFFGNAESQLKVVEPLMITPSLPRVLSLSDEFIVPVTVLNTTGKDGNAVVSVETSDGFNFVWEKSQSVQALNNKEMVVYFNLKAPALAIKAQITIKAVMGDVAVSKVTDIAVRPAVPFMTVSGSGVIKAPGTKAFKLSSDWIQGTEDYSLNVAAFPGLEFLGALKFLLVYPYGCIEQTTSSVFPLLYLKDLAQTVDEKKFSSAGVDFYVKEGIYRVLSMQTISGGFSMWPGYKEPNQWGSAYAAEFLIEAEKAGYDVPKMEKDAALKYLESLLVESKETASLSLKSYVCYVLSKDGKIKSSWIRRLQESQSELPAYARFYLAASLVELGDKKSAAQITAAGLADGKIERSTGDDWMSGVKSNAIALSVLMDVEPNNPLVQDLVIRIKNAMKDGQWGTTQDNAQALIALGKYARYIGKQTVSFTGSVSTDGKQVGQFSHTEPLSLKGKDLAGKDLSLSLEGQGDAFYYWSAEGVPSSGKAEEKDNGISVRREFLTKDGESLDLTKISQGDTVVVDILIKADAMYQNVVVVDILPAGFEIENPRIATSEKIDWLTEKSFEPGHVDVRDDRLLLFTDLPSTDNIHYRYIVRAVTKGKFILPAISASCMYDPTVESVSGQGQIEVK